MLSTILLLADAAADGRSNEFMRTIIMIVVAGIFFYFMMWRPESKRRQELQKKIDSMQPGDKVIANDIVGTVHRLEEKTVILKMCDGTKIEMLKTAVATVEKA